MGRPLTDSGQLFGMDGAGMFIEEGLPFAGELELSAQGNRDELEGLEQDLASRDRPADRRADDEGRQEQWQI
jgi:hypothetical protein